jgi:hypothetical protein
MTTTDIVDLCKRLRERHGGEHRLEAAAALQRQADEINRLRFVLVEAGMRIETSFGADDDSVKFIVQKIRAAMTEDESARIKLSD